MAWRVIHIGKPDKRVSVTLMGDPDDIERIVDILEAPCQDPRVLVQVIGIEYKDRGPLIEPLPTKPDPALYPDE